MSNVQLAICNDVEVREKLVAIRDFQIMKQEMDNMEQEIKEQIGEAMDASGLTRIDFEDLGIRITRVKGSTRTTIDSKRLKAEHPEIAAEYSKTSVSKPALKIEYD